MHPWLTPQGGGETVAAWTLQALRDTCHVTLITWDRPDYEGVNRMFGTSLRESDAHVVRPVLPRLGVRPARAHLMVTSSLLRRLRHLDRVAPFDLILGTHNAMDFGRPGVQYVHYPYDLGGPPRAEHRGALAVPGALRAYRAACAWIAPQRRDGVVRNVTLVNSRFVERATADALGVASRVIYPPVPGGFPDVAWEDREDGVACLGRIAPVKQWDDAVAVLDGLHARGHRLELHIIGMREDTAFEAHLRARAATRPWMHLHVNLSRDAMMALVARQRYGLHVQQGEHFGIAVAELVRAGCVVFVASPGGPEEIVGDDPALVFATPAQAIDRMARLMGDPDALAAAREGLVARRGIFTEERFMEEMRQVVASALGARDRSA